MCLYDRHNGTAGRSLFFWFFHISILIEFGKKKKMPSHTWYVVHRWMDGHLGIGLSKPLWRAVRDAFHIERSSHCSSSSGSNDVITHCACLILRVNWANQAKWIKTYIIYIYMYLIKILDIKIWKIGLFKQWPMQTRWLVRKIRYLPYNFRSNALPAAWNVCLHPAWSGHAASQILRIGFCAAMADAM